MIKADRLQDLRDNELFARWARGDEEHLDPVVVLGDRKERLTSRAPFDDQYAALRAAVASADTVVLAGYAFRDIPLNATIRATLPDSARVVVVNPDPTAPNLAAAALGFSAEQARNRIEHVRSGLPEGLPSVRNR